jgi:hypothetical protein
MNSPGIYDLGSRVITTELTDEVITSGVNEYVDNLEGMLSGNFEIRFSYGAGGTDCKVYVQTSLDQGDTWIDIAQAKFTTSSGTKVLNLSGLTPVTSAVSPTDGGMSDNSSIDGILGDRFRTKVTSTGTYTTNTSVAVRLNAR